MKTFTHCRLLIVFGLALAFVIAVMFPWDFRGNAVDLHPDAAPTALAAKAHVSAKSAPFKRGNSSFDFFGVKMCFPGYAAPECTARLQPANDWYDQDCPNLQDPTGKTFDENITIAQLGGRTGCKAFNGVDAISPCAYLCYGHPSYGTAMVPTVLWKHAQAHEGLWVREVAKSGISDERSMDAFEGFSFYVGVPRLLGPLKIMEVGAGPWTQTKGILLQRPDIEVSELTLLEPSAKWYMDNIATCSYKSGKLQKFASKSFHEFPIKFLADRGESLLAHTIKYDALVVMNVIEHVQNAFQLLAGLYHVLRPGGLLIFHERVHLNPPSADPVLGGGGFHPIRLPKNVFDVFFEEFQVLFSNFTSTSYMKQRGLGEQGYYVIGRKKQWASAIE